MLLRPLNDDGALAGTGTLTCKSRLFAVAITTDGTNAATVVVRKTDANGAQKLDYSTLDGDFLAGPFALDSETLYYSVTGTGAAAQFFEWVS